ncbi:MAG TPA: amidohydrolase [Anaerolineae bacterium]|nr:amidohydrolase [Anaerolineae bacterium]
MDISQFVHQSNALADEIVALRRDFHRHPELGFQEHRTAGVVAEAMTDLDLEVHTGIAETGIVALMVGGKPGPTVLLRFDMDALPVQEETGAPYASTHDGVMHACGHDGHTAIGITVAKLLHEHRASLPGVVKFVFQPAEEGMGGAERMVAEGVLENPRPDYSLAMHLWNDKPRGWIGIKPGPIMAGAEMFEIVIRGKGGHGAAPHQAIDPVLAAAQITIALQSVVSRNVDPRKSAVVSVTQFQAGEAFNIIPSHAIIRGTIRTFTPEVRDLVLQRVEEVSRGVAKAMGCDTKIEITQLTPPVVNDHAVARMLKSLAESMFPEATIDTNEFTMGSEDMAFLMEGIPSAYLFVGSSDSSRNLDAPHHNPHFDFDEAVLPIASSLVAASAWRLLEAS